MFELGDVLVFVGDGDTDNEFKNAVYQVLQIDYRSNLGPLYLVLCLNGKAKGERYEEGLREIQRNYKLIRQKSK